MNRLAEIFDHKRSEVEAAKREKPLAAIREQAAAADPPRPFLNALESQAGLSLIAEVKRASPSMGMIRESFYPAEIARAYYRAGANAVSVLTDEKYFLGHPQNIEIVKEAVPLPALRKDFIEDPYQVFEARAWGADAILLILASLEDALAQDLMALSAGLGMDTLVEVHTFSEAERAMKLGANLIGVNNRSLHTFQTDLATGEALLPQIQNAYKVAESALDSPEDLQRMHAAGADGVLIGTAFCASPNIEARVKQVMNW